MENVPSFDCSLKIIYPTFLNCVVENGQCPYILLPTNISNSCTVLWGVENVQRFLRFLCLNPDVAGHTFVKILHCTNILCLNPDVAGHTFVKILHYTNMLCLNPDVAGHTFVEILHSKSIFCLNPDVAGQGSAHFCQNLTLNKYLLSHT